jgi:hypothetical protein
MIAANNCTAKNAASLACCLLVPFAQFQGLEYNQLGSDSRKSTNKGVPMPFEKFEDAEAIDNERRKAIAKSIRIISVEELKKLGDEIFDEPDRPWRQTFLSVVTENPGATFYHASAGEGVILLYSRDDDKGLWYLPGSGIGPLSEGGRQLMRKAIETGR